jgi:peptide/nickel transport system substrate-binding protein
MLKKPRPRFLMISFSLLAVFILILNACGAAGGTSATPSTGAAVKGGTWIDDLFEEPDSLIPNLSNETYAAMVDYGLWAPLIYGDPQGKLHAGIATDVPTVTNGLVSADLKTWTFHLRPNLVWSDGQPENADDVDFTWKFWKNPKAGAIYTSAVNTISSADVSADKLTITFHLTQPFVAFATYFADGYYGILPAHHFATMDPASVVKSSDNLSPSVVSGPFMISEVKPGDHYTIVRNPKYYQASAGFPYLDKVVFRIVPDQNTILKDLQAGSVNSSWFLDVSKATAYQKLSGYKFVGNPNTTSFEALYFDFHNKVLANNPEVRQAMAMAVDQQALIDVARRGFGSKLCTEHSPASVPGYQPGLTCPQLNPDFAAANTLLDQHGWVKGSDGYRSKSGQRLEFQYSTTAGNLWRSDDQLINQTNFKKIGIKLDIMNYPASTLFGTFLSDGKPGVYDIVEYATGVSYDPDDSTFFPCNNAGQNPSNTTFYCNPKLDDLYKQQLSSGDPNVRQQAFNAIHQIELTDYMFIVEFAAPDMAVYKTVGHNYLPSAVGVGEDVNIWQWWCDNGKC